MAHTPHDDIFALATSPAFAEDQTAMVVSRAWLLRSVDAGATWERVVDGLTIRSQPQAISFSPDPQVVYLGTSGDGVLRSDDGGASWTSARVGLERPSIRVLSASPGDPAVVLAGAGDGTLFRTEDGGDSWSEVAGFGGRVGTIAFDPAEPEVVTAADRSGGLHRSDDGGATWTDAADPEVGLVTAVAHGPGPDGGRALWVGGESGAVATSSDGATTFTPVDAGIEGQQVMDFGFAPGAGDGRVWLSASDDGIRSSDDGGATWSTSDEGLTTNRQVGEDDYEGRTSFGPLRVAPGPDEDPVLLLGGFDGLFRSTDGGGSWDHVDTLRPGIIVGLDIAPGADGSHVVAVSTYINGIHLSTDGGDTWATTDDDLGEPHRYATRSDFIARLYSISVSPDFPEDETMFTATAGHFLRTTDAGSRWDQVPPADDDEGHHQFAVAISPDFGSDGTVFYGDGVTGGLFRTVDGGESFSRIATVGGGIASLAVSPTYASDSTLYAGSDAGLQVSRDGGESWTPMGGPDTTVISLGVSAEAPGTETLLAATTSGLHGSFDGGETWQAITPPGTDRAFVEGMAMSPAFVDDGTALLSLRGHGLYRSTDGGRTFEPIAPELLADNLILGNYTKPTGSPITFSPDFAQDRTIYGYSNTRVLRSTDGGDTWDALDIPVAEHPLPPDADLSDALSTPGRRTAMAVALGAAGAVGILGLAAVIAVRRRRSLAPPAPDA